MTRPATTASRVSCIGELVFARELPTGASIVDCLGAAWDEAQGEARSTYEEWRRSGGVDAYLLYRAAQDRADAAQDAMAQIAHGQVSQRAS